MASIEQIAAAFGAVSRRGRFYKFRCPLHGLDRHPSAEVWESHGRILFGCHVCHPAKNEKTELLRIFGLTWKDILDNDENWKRDMAFPRPRATAFYPYCDASGQLIYQEVRFEPGFDGQRKSIRVRRPTVAGTVPNNLDKSAWVWQIGDETPRILYRLPELRAALTVDPGRVVMIPEGCGKCDLLMELGLLATATAFGAATAWLDSYSEELCGANVALIPDNDATGWRKIGEAAWSLKRHGCSVRIVDPPGLGRSEDIKDFIRSCRAAGMDNPTLAAKLRGMLASAARV